MKSAIKFIRVEKNYDFVGQFKGQFQIQGENSKMLIEDETLNEIDV